MDISEIFVQMLLLFTLMAVGFVAAKARVLTPESNRHLSSIALYIANPCTILYSVLSGQATLNTRELLTLTLIALLFYVALIGLAALVPKLLRVAPGEVGIYRFMTVFSNIGFIGFPVVQAVYGQGAVFYAAIFNLFFQIFLFTYGVRQFSSETRFSIKMLAQPVIFVALTAYAIYLFSLQDAIAATATGRFVTRALAMVNGITSPLCMIITGVGLAQVPLKRVFTNTRLYLLAIGKQLLVPVAAFFILSPFVKNELMLGICVIMAAMPTGAMASLFCARYNGPGEVASSGVFLSTLLAIPAVPLLMAILFK